MKLYRVILPVGDIDEAADFYTRLFKNPGLRVSPGRHYFNLGGTILACYDPIADGDEEHPTWKPHVNQYIYIAVDHLQETFDTLKNLQPDSITDDIATMPWGERLFYATDPWDNPICFVDSATLFTGEMSDGH